MELYIKSYYMNKKDLIDAIAQKSGLDKREISIVLNAFIETASEKIKAGERVTLMGFGSIFMEERPPKRGYDVVRQIVSVFPPKKRIYFKPGKSFGVD